jgi:hypothetical protein
LKIPRSYLAIVADLEATVGSFILKPDKKSIVRRYEDGLRISNFEAVFMSGCSFLDRRAQKMLEKKILTGPYYRQLAQFLRRSYKK